MSFWRKPTPLGVTPANAYSELQRSFVDASKQQEIVKWVESGCDINWTCPDGLTLLHYAAMQDNEKMVRYLLDHGANVNARATYNMTPLLLACKEISTSVVPTLLARGADPHAQAEGGYTALTYISRSFSDKAKKIEELLIGRGVARLTSCPECGAPETEQMLKRGVHVTLNFGVYAEFTCRRCNAQQEVRLDRAKGVHVACSCGVNALVPPSVWCRTCGKGLSNGWQSKVTIVGAAQRHTQNLLRWERSEFPARWVADHHGQWNHADWLDLLERLRHTDFWPMEPDAIGRVLERLKRG
jgi:hypothetical protein